MLNNLNQFIIITFKKLKGFDESFSKELVHQGVANKMVKLRLREVYQKEVHFTHGFRVTSKWTKIVAKYTCSPKELDISFYSGKSDNCFLNSVKRIKILSNLGIEAYLTSTARNYSYKEIINCIDMYLEDFTVQRNCILNEVKEREKIKTEWAKLDKENKSK